MRPHFLLQGEGEVLCTPLLGPVGPDLNPLDFFVWGMTERDVNRSPHNTKQSLITSIMKVFADLSREDVRRACSRFRSRLEEVIEARGDFIH
jgi:hypothetical protein